MTVIAWDGKNLAVDKQVTVHGHQRLAVTKGRKLKNGDVVAACGNWDVACALIEWYANGADPKAMPKNEDKEGDDECDLIVARKGFSGLFIYNRYPTAQYMESRLQAYGSGAAFAMSALLLGKTAKQAIEFASTQCIYCGMGVDNFVVNAPPSKKKPKAKKAKKK